MTEPKNKVLDLSISDKNVVPAKAGIQKSTRFPKILGSSILGYDKSTSQNNPLKEKKSIFDLTELEKFFSKEGFSVKLIQRFRRKLFKDYTFNPSVDIPECEDTYSEKMKSSYLKLIKRQDSNIDGASRLLFTTEDGYNIETVILRLKTGRVTLCVSSQAGCTEKCTFCATAKLGFARNLQANEILDQVYQASAIVSGEGIKVRNIVFMGMGEPLRNLDQVKKSLTCLLAGKMFAFADKNITVSTSGIASKIIEFTQAFPKVGLALSLNAQNDEVREKIMPINKKYPMQTLKNTLLEVQTFREGEFMIEYVLFKELNDSVKDAVVLGDYLKGLRVHINLISYNNSDTVDFIHASSEDSQIRIFQKKLQDQGFPVTRRYSLGQDIDAACGQLANSLSKN